ncbi:MAG: dihydrodipicolinate synthase family protein [Endozoicomonas sp.]|uniref:dihydrodipicolinate synthase family protein n=1 Tax=Endozoicomonas sp. TaxID=1892382 RepID=UPI003D9B69AA
MWSGVIPAVTTKFSDQDQLDLPEMKRCFEYMMAAGCDGFIVGGSLGEGSMLSTEEKLTVLKLAKEASQIKPTLLTINEASTRDACALAEEARRAGADGLMIVPSPIYHTDERETVTALRAVAEAGDLPVMIYSNRVAYRVDVTTKMMKELAEDSRFVAVKESSDDIRRTTDIVNALGDRYNILTGVDNLAFEAITAGAVGWVAGLVVAFPRETVAIYQLIQQGRYEEARAIYRWFRPLLDLDVSTYLVQNIKLAEAIEIESTEQVRAPRLPLVGARRAHVEAVVREAIACRPVLPEWR